MAENEQLRWYYTQAGEICSPVTEDEIIRMIRNGELRYGESVWNSNLRDWILIESSPFAPALQKYCPPPITHSPSSRSYEDSDSGNGLAIATLALGIISLVLLLTGIGIIISLITSIVGVCIGHVAKRKVSLSHRMMAKAGYICSIVSLSLIVIMTILMLFGIFGILISD